MKHMFILSALVSFVLVGCDSNCCSNPDEVISGKGNAVNLIAPTANLAIPTADLSRESGSNLTLNGSDFSSDRDGTVASYLWTFQNPAGETSTFTQERPSFNFPTAGTYEICLTVTDNDDQQSNKSCKQITISDAIVAPQYIIPEPVVTILDANGNKVNPPVVFQVKNKYTFDATKSYDPDNLDQKNIIAYHWALTEYRKDSQGVLFKKTHYCNVPGHADHSACPTNGDYSKLQYTIHGSEIYRIIKLTVEDSDVVNGTNQTNTKTFEYKTNLYNNEDLNAITRDLTPPN